MVLGSVQTNCYFLYEEGQKDVICIDPADQGNVIYEKLTEQGFAVKAILLTHAHFDHIWGTNELIELSGAPLYACEAEQEVCEDAFKNVSKQVSRPYTVSPDHYVKDGDTITVGTMTCKVIATPGHTIGSCCYYFEEDGILVSGDTLFQDSVGRTDLPTGSFKSLKRSIREKLFVLPEDVKVFPGHGPQTQIGHEKAYNTFC